MWIFFLFLGLCLALFEAFVTSRTYCFFCRVYLSIKIWSLRSAKGQFIKSHFAYKKAVAFLRKIIRPFRPKDCFTTHLPNKNWQLHMQSRMNLKSSPPTNTLVMTIADFQMMMAIFWKCFEGPLVVEVSFWTWLYFETSWELWRDGVGVSKYVG